MLVEPLDDVTRVLIDRGGQRPCCVLAKAAQVGREHHPGRILACQPLPLQAPHAAVERKRVQQDYGREGHESNRALRSL